MSGKLTVALSIGVMLVGAALRVLLGTNLAIAALLIAAMLIVFVSMALNEDAEDERLSISARNHL